MDKVGCYLEHDEERVSIESSRRSLFEQLYDPLRDGREMRREFECIVGQRKKGTLR
jgi:hypothetical protein